MLLRTNLPTFQGVSVGGMATCERRLGEMVYADYLRLSDDGTASSVANTGAVGSNGLTTAQIEGIMDRIVKEIRLQINSKTQRRMMASQLNQLNGLNGSRYLAIASGTPGTPDFTIYLPIFYAEFWRKNPVEVPALAWNLNPKGGPVGSDGKSHGDVEGAQIQIDLQDNVVTGGQNSVNAPDISGYYLYTPANLDKGIGSINKWIPTDLQAIGTKNDFRLDRTQLIQSLHLWPTQEAAPKTVSYFRLNASGTDVQDRLSAIDNVIYLYSLELQPDTNLNRFDWVSDADDPILNALVAGTQSSLTMYLEYSGAAAGNLPLMIQRIGAPD